ncbi:putative aldolase-type TIM barrel [Rosa chinensis]|uniref:Putative aldolase-type TIM barrel n=1 Tax=Rosa chinensis TaxID=74649 RepID=A0A2P6QCM1_ROSCH|nr:putative aldolase-type TIM barrel [Rosa chinensis]
MLQNIEMLMLRHCTLSPNGKECLYQCTRFGKGGVLDSCKMFRDWFEYVGFFIFELMFHCVNCGWEGRPIGAYELAKAVKELRAGEILLNCIDCYGKVHFLHSLCLHMQRESCQYI